MLVDALLARSWTATFSKPSASEIAWQTRPSSSDGVPGLVQVRRDREQRLERVAIRLRARRLLGRFDRERRVLADGDQYVELVAGRLAAGDRLVDREDPEQRAVRAAHRGEQRVVRMPRTRVVGDGDVGREGRLAVGLPVELAGGNEVHAALEIALVEQRLPVGHLADAAEQRLARLVAPVDGADDEIVPFAPVEIDDDRAEGERVRDRLRDRG